MAFALLAARQPAGRQWLPAHLGDQPNTRRWLLTYMYLILNSTVLQVKLYHFKGLPWTRDTTY